MATDFWDKLGEAGIDFGLEWLKGQLDSEAGMDKQKVADTMLTISVQCVRRIVEMEYAKDDISAEDFMNRTAVVMGAMAAFFICVSGVNIELSDLSISLVDRCAESLSEMKQKASHISVSHAIVKAM